MIIKKGNWWKLPIKFSWMPAAEKKEGVIIYLIRLPYVSLAPRAFPREPVKMRQHMFSGQQTALLWAYEAWLQPPTPWRGRHIAAYKHIFLPNQSVTSATSHLISLVPTVQGEWTNGRECGWEERRFVLLLHTGNYCLVDQSEVTATYTI